MGQLRDRSTTSVSLAEIGAQRGVWIIHYSADYVFDGRKPAPYIETDATNPQSVYGRTKRDCERALTSSGAKHLIFRTSWVHSGRGHNFIQTVLRLAGERDSLRVVADQVGAPTAAELIADVTAHAVAAIKRASPLASGIYHLTASGETTWHGLARFAIAEALSRGAFLNATAESIAPIATAEYAAPAARPANSRLDTTKLQAALGITLPDWRIHAGRSVAELLERRAA